VGCEPLSLLLCVHILGVDSILRARAQYMIHEEDETHVQGSPQGRRSPKAFDDLWSIWTSDMVAMIYVDFIQVMDLILLTSIVDNRGEIERFIKK